MQTKPTLTSIPRRLTMVCLALVAAAVLMAGCGGATTIGEADATEGAAQAGQTGGAAGDTDAADEGDARLVDQNGDTGDAPAIEDLEPSGPTVEESVDSLLDRFDLAGDPADTDRVRAELAAALLPAGSDQSDTAVANAIAARLGAEYAGEQDLGVLIDALAEELSETATIDSVESLVAALDQWADTGIITFGPASGAEVITAATSFEQAADLIERPGAIVDVLAGLGTFEIADVTVTVDEAARQIRITGQLPAPLSGPATITVTWGPNGPELSLDVVPGTIVLADLLPDADLGSLGQVGASDVAVSLDGSGVSGTAQMIADAIPGLEDLDLGSTAVPVAFSTAGFGAWADAADIEPISLTIPLGELPLYGSWNTARTGSIAITLASNPVVGYEETVTAVVGGDTLVFTGAGTVGDGNLDLALVMTGDWVAPFDASWLTLRNVELTAGGNRDEQYASIRGGYTLAGKSGILDFEVSNDGANTNASATGTLDSLVVGDLTSIAQELTGTDFLPAGVSVPSDVLALRNISVTFTSNGGERSLSLAATTEILGQVAEAAVSVVPIDGTYTTVIAVTPRDVSLAGIFPELEGNDIVGDVRLPNSTFVLTSRDIRAAASAFDPTMAGKLGTTSGGDISLPSGISLRGTIPTGTPAVEAIDDLKEVLGMERNAPLRISGTIPGNALKGGGGDFVIEATLPAMTPADSDWLVSAELGFRITSQPSVGVFGAMTLDMKGDIQSFEVEASIARTNAGVAVNFVGRLGNPWETPFDVEWLTLNEVVLKLGMEPVRGATIAFLADMQVGTKDIRGAMGIRVSPTGAPTNFLFEFASQEGVSLGDLADLYSHMSGQARPPVEAVLPAIEIRNIELRFAPEGDADLGIEQGFKVAGALHLDDRDASSAEVDVEVSDAGIFAAGNLTGITLGAVEFAPTMLDLEVSAADQRLSFAGGVKIVDTRVDVNIDVTRTEMTFRTTGAFGDAEAALEVEASYDLDNPSWTVRAIMNEEFIQEVDEVTEALIGSKISDLNAQLRNGRNALKAAETALDVAQEALRLAKIPASVPGACFVSPALCIAVDTAQAEVDRLQAKVRALREQADRGEALLELYQVQLTVVGAEFEAAFGDLESNQVSMSLIVEADAAAGTVQFPVPVEWNFNKSVNANMTTGLIDGIVQGI